MNWVLLIILAGVAPSDKVTDTTTVPMETEESCNAAKDRLNRSFSAIQSPHFVWMLECIPTRS